MTAYDSRIQWLRIDFGEWKHVMFVEIHNRKYDQAKISNSEIYVYGENPTENRQLCAIIIDGNHPVFYLPCSKKLYGKGIELYYPQQPTNEFRVIHICEMIVLGY